jgi:bacterioferritin-associated ferredoxin
MRSPYRFWRQDIANDLQTRSQTATSWSPARSRSRAMYVCNCNGIRERQVRAAIAAGASRPAQIFKACDSAAQCARCVCDMRKILDEERQALRYAAE